MIQKNWKVTRGNSGRERKKHSKKKDPLQTSEGKLYMDYPHKTR